MDIPWRRVARLRYFYNPSLDAVVDAVVDADSLPWSRCGARADVSATNSQGAHRVAAAYGINAFKSLARSHPRVFARHHPDLEVRRDGSVGVRGAAAGE